jgi:hypothetical protein
MAAIESWNENILMSSTYSFKEGGAAIGKRIKGSTILRTLVVLLTASLATICYFTYFSESVFYLNDEKYKQIHSDGKFIHYENSRGHSIQVQMIGQDRKVIIDSETYSIIKQIDEYELIYPDGSLYYLEYNGNSFLSYDEKGDIIAQVSLYVGGQRVLQGEEELYHPESMIRAAYSDYHTAQGNGVLFAGSLLLFAYGWSGFRYIAFQNLLFKLSPERLYVRDAEPSDFYYFMCKVGGIAVMLFAAYLVVKAFFG